MGQYVVSECSSLPVVSRERVVVHAKYGHTDCSRRRFFAHREHGPSREEAFYSESELNFVSNGMTHAVGTHSVAEERQHAGRSLHPIRAAERTDSQLGRTTDSTVSQK